MQDNDYYWLTLGRYVVDVSVTDGTIFPAIVRKGMFLVIFDSSVVTSDRCNPRGSSNEHNHSSWTHKLDFHYI